MKILSLAFRDTIKSRNSIMLFIGLIISVVFPIFIYMVTNSFMVSADQMASQIYGYFDNILYMEEGYVGSDETETVPNLISDYADIFGVIRIYEVEEEEEITVGYIDNNGISLGCVRLLEGKLPEKKDEIAVCNSLIYKNDWKDKLGNPVTIGDKNYILVGIINDYSALWNKPVNNNSIYIPNVLISDDTIGENYNNIYQEHFLIKNSVNFDENIYLNNPNLISNVNRANNNSSSKYRLPFFVIILTTCCSLLLNIYIFNFYFEMEQRKMSLLRCLALNNVQLIWYTFAKVLIVALISIAVGILIGNGGAYLSVKLFNHILNIDKQYVNSNIYIWYSVLICFIISLISIYIVSYRIKRLNPLDIYRKGYRSEKKEVILILFSAFSMALFITLFVYMNNYAEQVSDVFGKMPINYDYEFITDLNSVDVSYVDDKGQTINIKTIPDDDTVFYLPDYNHIIPNSVIHDIEKESGVRNVSEYMEINNLYLYHAPPELNNKYLNYFRNETMLDESITSKFNLTENILKIQYMGYPEKEILDLKEYLAEGEINIDKIKSGEEVILMIPVYEFEDLGDGYYQQNFIPYNQYENKSNQYKDTYFSVGDEITFLQFYSPDGELNGYIDRNQVNDCLQYKQYKTKVGAIIYERVKWFDNATQPPAAYTILGLNEAIINMDMFPEISRVQIYLNNNISYKDFDDTIRYYHEQLSDFSFRNNAAEMQEYREFKLVINSICLFLIITICIIIAIIMLIEDKINFESRRKYYGLLHINGLDNKRLSARHIMKAVKLQITALILSFPVLIVMADHMYGSIEYFVKLISISNTIFIFVYVLSMIFFSCIVTLVSLRKRTIAQMIID